MTRYSSWEQFMADVLDTADCTVNLKELFDLKDIEVVKIIIKILLVGWLVFNGVVLLLSLAFPAFLAALGSFSMTPTGVALLVIFGIGMVNTMKLLYQNRQLPLAIKKVGDNKKDEYYFIKEKYTNDTYTLTQEIDELLFEAVDALISLATDEAEALKSKAISATFEKIYLGYSDPDATDISECFNDIGKAIIEVEQENLKSAAKDRIEKLLTEKYKTLKKG